MSNIHTLSDHILPRLILPFADQGDLSTAWEQVFLNADRVVYWLDVGTIATDTVDMKLEQATDSGGSGVKDITDAAIVQMAAATADDQLNSIDIAPGALDDAGGFKWVRATVDIGSSGAEPYSIIRILYRLRTPGVTSQHSSYAQQITVR